MDTSNHAPLLAAHRATGIPGDRGNRVPGDLHRKIARRQRALSNAELRRMADEILAEHTDDVDSTPEDDLLDVYFETASTFAAAEVAEDRAERILVADLPTFAEGQWNGWGDGLPEWGELHTYSIRR